MSDTSVVDEPVAEAGAYNERAIAWATRLTEVAADRASDRDDREAPSLDQLLPAFDQTARGVHDEYEAMGNRPVSAALQDRADAAGVRFEHLGLTIGTVLHDVDLRDPDPSLVGLIRQTLLERKVIFFRDQHLSEDQQVAFGRCFGELDAFPFGPPGTNPFVLEIIHGERSPGRENGWHTDVTWMEQPSLGSIAQCVEVPPIGGDTLFSDSHAAYLGLQTELRERIADLAGVHDYRLFLAGRGQGAVSDELIEQLKADIPFGVVHPLVRTHPETGKDALYLHGGFLRHDSLHDARTGEALAPEESRQIVAKLLAQHGRPEYQCRFGWELGSIAFWDNRAAQHYAASDYYPHRRVLRRVTVSGDRPVNRRTPNG